MALSMLFLAVAMAHPWSRRLDAHEPAVMTPTCDTAEDTSLDVLAATVAIWTECGGLTEEQMETDDFNLMEVADLVCADDCEPLQTMKTLCEGAPMPEWYEAVCNPDPCIAAMMPMSACAEANNFDDDTLSDPTGACAACGTEITAVIAACKDSEISSDLPAEGFCSEAEDKEDKEDSFSVGVFLGFTLLFQ